MKQKIQIVLVIAIAVAALRAGWIFYQRYEANQQEQAKKATGSAPPLNPDYYVTPKKLHAYDLKSARELAKQPVWVKEGYRYAYYPYNPASHRASLSHEAGFLLPLQRLQIKDVVLAPSTGAPGQKQVLAVFQQQGKDFAFPIGSESAGDYRIYADEVVFIEDPKELYKHWPSDVWDSIDKHEVKPGMNEIQATFAIGMGVPEGTGLSNPRIVNFPNNGHPMRVTFTNGKATDIQPTS